mmetsp:Transcript_78539/g.255041  ORF Transcript_78539/g.255041 Transcript_78539/m.255041 type:complete len:209 (-) Transcript_78539:647-1273(-)
MHPAHLKREAGAREPVRVIVHEQAQIGTISDAQLNEGDDCRGCTDNGEVEVAVARQAVDIQDVERQGQCLEGNHEGVGHKRRLRINQADADHVICQALDHLPDAQTHADPSIGVVALPLGLELTEELHMPVSFELHSPQHLGLPASDVINTTVSILAAAQPILGVAGVLRAAGTCSAAGLSIGRCSASTTSVLRATRVPVHALRCICS